MRWTKMGEGCGKFLALLVLFSAVFSLRIFAEPLDNWHLREPHVDDLGVGEVDLRGIVYGNGRFVAVGDMGVVSASVNGGFWQSKFAGDKDRLYGVAYGDSTFVMVGDNGTVLTSSDGIGLKNRRFRLDVCFYGVAYGNNTFVAVGYNGRDKVGVVSVSTDKGVTWTSNNIGANKQLRGVTYGNGIFVAVGNDTKESIIIALTSSDGIGWINRPGIRVGYSFSYCLGVGYGNGVFVALEWDKGAEAGVILTSSDGISWTSRIYEHDKWFDGVAYGNGTFVVVGGDNSGVSTVVLILTSSNNGVDWAFKEVIAPDSYPPHGIYGYLGSVTYGNNTFVAAGGLSVGDAAILQSDPVVLPDLVVDSTSYDKKKKTLSVKIWNIGKADVPRGTGIRIDIYVNGVFNGCAIYNTGISSGQTKTITKSRTPYGRFGVIIDPGNMIKETNETNNTFGEVPKSK